MNNTDVSEITNEITESDDLEYIMWIVGYCLIFVNNSLLLLLYVLYFKLRKVVYDVENPKLEDNPEKKDEEYKPLPPENPPSDNDDVVRDEDRILKRQKRLKMLKTVDDMELSGEISIEIEDKGAESAGGVLSDDDIDNITNKISDKIQNQITKHHQNHKLPKKDDGI
jgi:hypothetical protein